MKKKIAGKKPAGKLRGSGKIKFSVKAKLSATGALRSSVRPKLTQNEADRIRQRQRAQNPRKNRRARMLTVFVETMWNALKVAGVEERNRASLIYKKNKAAVEQGNHAKWRLNPKTRKPITLRTIRTIIQEFR